MMQCRRIVALCLTILLSGCADKAAPPGVAPAEELPHTVAVLSPAVIFEQDWQHVRIKHETTFALRVLDGAVVLTAEGAGGASGLYRFVEVDAAVCPALSWSWRVDKIQRGADLTSKAGDDVGAAVFVLFGDPGMLSAPKPVPSLRYVWTGQGVERGRIIANPYLPEHVKNVVLRNGSDRLGVWRDEQRDLAADFAEAFGRAPDDLLYAIAVFVDNDQTGEPVLSHLRRIDLQCSEDPGAM